MITFIIFHRHECKLVEMRQTALHYILITVHIGLTLVASNLDEWLPWVSYYGGRTHQGLSASSNTLHGLHYTVWLDHFHVEGCKVNHTQQIPWQGRREIWWMHLKVYGYIWFHETYLHESQSPDKDNFANMMLFIDKC